MMNIKIIMLSFLVGLIGCNSNKDQENINYKTITVKPVNETKAIPELNLFINELIKAIDRKDTAFVLSVVDNDVEVSAGGGLYGKEAFLNEFIKESNGLEKLKQVLELGGTIETDEDNQVVYSFPYLQSYKLYKDQLDTIELDPYLTAISFDSALVIFNKPNDNSEKKAVIPYPLLKLDPDSGYMESNWAKVSTIDNKLIGFAKKDKLYFAADIILNIKKKENDFKIVGVIPYD